MKDQIIHTIEMSYKNHEDTIKATATSFWKTGQKTGSRAFKFFLLTFLLFVVTNVVFFGISLHLFINSLKRYQEVIGLTGVFLTGVLFNVIAFYYAYKSIVKESMFLLYQNLEFLMRKTCALVIREGVNVCSESRDGTHIGRLLNLADMIEEVYGRKIPRVLQRKIILIIERIPFFTIMAGIRNIQANTTEKTLSEAFYIEVDQYVQTFILMRGTMGFVKFLFPLNMLIQGLLVKFLMS